MRTLAIAFLTLALLGTLGAGVASAQQYPTVATLHPFSAQTNFMSLAGYLRYLVHQQRGTWLTYAESVRIVAQQRGQ